MDPDRRRLVTALMDEPDSAVGLARRLEDSRQRLNNPLRVLEEAGLVEVQEERPRRGVKERVMRVVARRFVVDPGALGALSPPGHPVAAAAPRARAPAAPASPPGGSVPA